MSLSVQIDLIFHHIHMTHPKKYLHRFVTSWCSHKRTPLEAFRENSVVG